MPAEENSVDQRRLRELEDELAGVEEFITKINNALASIDSDDLDRLTEEGGRRAILVRRKQEIVAELATLRAEAGPPTNSEVPTLSCHPIVTGVSLNSVAYTPDGTALLSGGNDGLVLRDAKSGTTLRTYDFGKGRLSAAVSPDGRFVAGRHYEDGTVIFALETGARVANQHAARSQANIAFSANNSELLAVLDGARTRVTVDRFLGGGSRAIGYGFSHEITFFTLTPDGRALLATDGPRCLLFGVSDGQPSDCPNLGGGGITAVAFASGNPLTILGNFSGRIGIATLSEPYPDRFRLDLTHLLPEAGRGRVHDLALSPDGQLFAARCPAQIQLFRITAGQAPVHLASYTGVGSVDVVARRTLLFAPDGCSFVTAGYQGIYRGDVTHFL